MSYPYLRVGMAVFLFLLGAASILIGLGIAFSKEFVDALRSLTRDSSQLGTKAAQDAAFLPLVEGASRLVESVTKMVQTAIGVGAFLCLLGAGLCSLAYWMIGPAK